MKNYYIKRIAPFFLSFIIIETLLRVVLLVNNREHIDHSVIGIFKCFAAGFVFDISVFAYIASILAFYLLFLPAKKHGSKVDKYISSFLYFILIYTMLFTTIGEWFFWDEFSARYNFIAVDYLVYMDEVVGNIRESYPVVEIMLGVAVISAFVTIIYCKRNFNR